MPDTTATDTAPAKPAAFSAATVNFSALASSLANIAIEATDNGDDAEFHRALSYRAAVRRIAERWAAGERSPTRTTAAKSDAEGA